MANRTKKSTQGSKTSKKRLAIPASLIRNFEDARKGLKAVQKNVQKSLETFEVDHLEKIYDKVATNDFVKMVRKNDLVKKATRVGLEVRSDVEGRIRQVGKDFSKISKNLDVKNFDFLSVLPVASRSDVERLQKKVADLSRRLEKMGEESTTATN